MIINVVQQIYIPTNQRYIWALVILSLLICTISENLVDIKWYYTIILLYIFLFTNKVKQFCFLLSIWDLCEMLFLSFAQFFLFSCHFYVVFWWVLLFYSNVVEFFRLPFAPLLCSHSYFPKVIEMTFFPFHFKVLVFVSRMFQIATLNQKSDEAMCTSEIQLQVISVAVTC